MWKKSLIVLLAIGFIGIFSSYEAMAVTAANIDVGVKRSMNQLQDISGANAVVKRAAGVLVFPSVFKAGFVIGGEYGEGALLIKGKTVNYYSTVAGSFGFQLGGQKKTVVIAFMDPKELEKFQRSSGWKVGADAAVTVIAIGADGSVDTAKTNKPVVAFVFDKKGLMYNLTLNGAKITKLKR